MVYTKTDEIYDFLWSGEAKIEKSFLEDFSEKICKK